MLVSKGGGNPEQEIIRILSIDGGGIRGIIPAMILEKIETETRLPISSLFHLIAGTSTGGIIALALNKPDKNGNPEFSAHAVAKMYEERGTEIFHSPILHTIRAVNNLIDGKYPDTGINNVLDDYFKDTMLSESISDVIIPAYEIERRNSFFFTSAETKTGEAEDFPMRLVARSTSAAPTYFPPAMIPTKSSADYYALVDGGLFANNPAMCAFVEAVKMFPNHQLFLMVSLGTGSITQPIRYDRATNWGLIQWAQPILDCAFDGQSDTVDYQLRHLLNTSIADHNYFRFQPYLDKDNDRMDDAARDNIRNLKLTAEKLLKDQEVEIKLLCDMLKKAGHIMVGNISKNKN